MLKLGTKKLIIFCILVAGVAAEARELEATFDSEGRAAAGPDRDILILQKVARWFKTPSDQVPDLSQADLDRIFEMDRQTIGENREAIRAYVDQILGAGEAVKLPGPTPSETSH